MKAQGDFVGCGGRGMPFRAPRNRYAGATEFEDLLAVLRTLHGIPPVQPT